MEFISIGKTIVNQNKSDDGQIKKKKVYVTTFFFLG